MLREAGAADDRSTDERSGVVVVWRRRGDIARGGDPEFDDRKLRIEQRGEDRLDVIDNVGVDDQLAVGDRAVRSPMADVEDPQVTVMNGAVVRPCRTRQGLSIEGAHGRAIDEFATGRLVGWEC